MKKQKIAVKWKPLLTESTKKRKKLYGIYSEEEFSHWVKYERDRSDRKATPLALVIYSFNGNGKNAKNIEGFIDTLVKNVRSTDHLGWANKESIGILLPETDMGGARKFVEHLHSDLNYLPTKPHIYSYPETWFENQGRTGKEIKKEKDNTESNQLPFTTVNPSWKRVLDIIGASLGLLFLSPLFLIISLYIKIVSPGPVFFKQKRVGQGRKEFIFIKFRTMKPDNNETVHSHHAKDFINFDKPMEKLDNKDPRIIFGGKVLRKSCIDELPQLINILKGDMSLVGPRPCIPYEAEEYARWHAHRFALVPGLTGLWQVSGKNKLTFKQMIRLDIAYEKNMSLLFDLKIILLTIPTVFNLVFEAIEKRLRGEQGCEDTESKRKRFKILKRCSDEKDKNYVDSYDDTILISK